MAKRSLAAQVMILKRCTGTIKREIESGRKRTTAQYFLGRAEKNLLYAHQALREWEAYCKEDAETVRIHEPLSENKT